MRRHSLAAGAAALAMTVVAGWQATPGRAAATVPVTDIVVNGNGGDRTYDGVGAVLGGGGNARYLMDYPEPQRSQILDELFTPGVGASLQLLKLEIGGDANSSDGAEPSVEHVKGQVTCGAGYELAIAREAAARNRFLRLYGLQWTAPGWVGDGANSVFTDDDIAYLLDWLGCTRQYGLTVSYLGGWNESDGGGHGAWFHQLRTALDSHGYGSVQIVAGDDQHAWEYTDSPDVAILGAHDVCGFPTGQDGPTTTCHTTTTALNSGKPLWHNEVGAMDAGAQHGCTIPCAPAMDRATVRGYIDARMTGYLEWPVIDAMPAGLPYENRGMVTADQPWSGSYQVNAMTWAIAHFTQFVWPPTASNPGGWKYVDSASGFLRGDRTHGSYVTLLRGSRDEFSTIIETTSGPTADQQVHVTVTGGDGLAGKTVHVWASDFDFDTDSPTTWFMREPDVKPVDGSFTLTVHPGWVYSLTTTTGQGKGAVSPPPAAPLPLPYADDLSTAGSAGTADDEPELLAAQDGAFELAPCAVPDGTATTCTVQQAPGLPVIWHGGADPGTRYPYATLGDASWSNYTVGADVLLSQAGTSAGLIGRFAARGKGQPNLGKFDGYVFDVSSTGAWRLIRNSTGEEDSTGQPTSAPFLTLGSGTLPSPPGVNSWHHLALSMAGTALTASVDGRQVVSVTDDAHLAPSAGQAGVEAGAFHDQWPQAQYSHLAVTPTQP